MGGWGRGGGREREGGLEGRGRLRRMVLRDGRMEGKVGRDATDRGGRVGCVWGGGEEGEGEEGGEGCEVGGGGRGGL